MPRHDAWDEVQHLKAEFHLCIIAATASLTTKLPCSLLPLPCTKQPSKSVGCPFAGEAKRDGQFLARCQAVCSCSDCADSCEVPSTC